MQPGQRLSKLKRSFTGMEATLLGDKVEIPLTMARSSLIAANSVPEPGPIEQVRRISCSKMAFPSHTIQSVKDNHGLHVGSFGQER